MTDLLNMNAINSLPQPLFCLTGGTWWPIESIDVETGLMRIDVCGMLDVIHFGAVIRIRDSEGALHDTDDFYVEDDQQPSAEGEV